MQNAILLIDKPVGFSSFQIVRLLKKRYKKIGHAGTLDPFASGLLIILIGRETKKFMSIQTFDKEYIGEFVLGVSTHTYDISGEAVNNLNKFGVVSDDLNVAHFSLKRFNELAQTFVGKVKQRPPRFSAIKQGGRRLYELSRKGIEVTPKVREVIIRSFTITAVYYPFIMFHVIVGKGVYIRSLANDFGDLIGCGATLMSLRRIRVGEYDVSQAKKIGDILRYRNLKNSYTNSKSKTLNSKQIQITKCKVQNKII